MEARQRRAEALVGADEAARAGLRGLVLVEVPQAGRAAPQEIPVGILTSLAARLRRCTGYADPAFWMNQPVRTTSGFSMHSTVFSTALRARESASS